MLCCFFQILVVIEPLLIDEDYYARVEGREIISNLAKVSMCCLWHQNTYQSSFLAVLFVRVCCLLFHDSLELNHDNSWAVFSL